MKGTFILGFGSHLPRCLLLLLLFCCLSLENSSKTPQVLDGSHGEAREKPVDLGQKDEGNVGSDSDETDDDSPPHQDARAARSKNVSSVRQGGEEVDKSLQYNGAGADVMEAVREARELAGSTVGFWHGFVASVAVIVVSELGDKTWFIAAIMAMRHSRLTVFAGAMAALGLMTVLSACLGWATQIIPRTLTYYVSTALFALFGLKMLKEGYAMSPSEGQDEYKSAEDEVQKVENERLKDADLEAGVGPASVGVRRSSASAVFSFVSKIFLEAFTLTFLAEWGDRSQITTIILAARENVAGVTFGGIIGHGFCTGIAVLGGRLVAQRISVRTVTLIGGVVFIIFALSAFFFNAEDS